MLAYLARRLVQSVLILLGVSFITYVLLFVLPADPVRQIAGRSATVALLSCRMPPPAPAVCMSNTMNELLMLPTGKGPVGVQ